MNAEPHADDGAAGPLGAAEAPPVSEPLDRGRPNLSGDLSTVFSAAPMFRRAVVGYDRFQVDTYVQWAEDELAATEREREHLVERHLDTLAALDEAQQLLARSADAGEFLRASRRIGTMLAAAADEAQEMRAEADAVRAAASAQAQAVLADAQRALAEARAGAERMIADAAAEVEGMIIGAGRIVDAAEQTRRESRAEADGRLGQVREIERRALEEAGLVRRRAVAEASVARLQARDEAVRMLVTGREERRRADAEAAGARERLDREAATRRADLLAEVAALEDRKSTLRQESALPAAPAKATVRGQGDVHRFPERLRWRVRSLRHS
jgi:hypothetical protein